MKLVGVELVRLAVPFRSDVGTAVGVHRSRSLLFVRVVADQAEGWGECAALGEGTSVDPSVDEVEAAVAGPGGATAARRHGRTGRAAAPGDRDRPALRELAGRSHDGRRVRDGRGRRRAAARRPFPGRRRWRWVRATRRSRSGRRWGSRPITTSGSCASRWRRRSPGGAARVRVKIEPGWDARTGGGAAGRPSRTWCFQVDANGSYRHRRTPSGWAGWPSSTCCA